MLVPLYVPKRGIQMITENSKIENTVIFSDDNTHRYLLSRIWNTSKEIPLFITKTAGQAKTAQACKKNGKTDK